jgi:hypothetical protein
MEYNIGLILGSIGILALWSQIYYKETIIYSIAEHIYIGIATGYILVVGIKTIMLQAVTPVQTGTNLIFLLPIILGLVLFTQISAKTRFMARIPLAMMAGIGLSLSIRRVILSNFIEYLKASARPVFGVPAVTAINNVIIMVGVVTTLLYFVMSKEHTGVYGRLTKIGRMFMMVVFGIYMGSQVAMRFSIIAGQFEYILKAFGII